MYIKALVEIKPKSSREEAGYVYFCSLLHPLMIVLILNSPEIVIAKIGSSAISYLVLALSFPSCIIFLFKGAFNKNLATTISSTLKKFGRTKFQSY